MPGNALGKKYAAVLLMVLVVLVCTVSADCAHASIPMPYTDEAFLKLNGAIEKVNPPPPAVNPGENDRNVKNYIDAYRSAFALAGFDYERSVMKIINDIQFDRYRLNRATIRLNGLARELLRVHVKTGVNPKKYLSKDCAELLIEFRSLIQCNMKKYGGC